TVASPLSLAQVYRHASLLGVLAVTAGVRFALAGLIALLLISDGIAATDNNPLRPSDTSSPRATLQGFVETGDNVYRHIIDVLLSYATSDRLYLSQGERRQLVRTLRDAPKVIRFLDASRIAPVLRDTVTVERVLQLKEILDRIDIPAFADIPDR